MASSANSEPSVPKPSTSNCSTRKQLERRNSNDTLCSSNQSCILQRRKPVHPLAASIRFPQKLATNAVKQRVLSARLLKLRSVQSQLNDANFHLAELTKENRALKILQKRQDKALKNYEGVDAELPRLIKTFEEELRVCQDKNKSLKRSLKETLDQLKIKEEELNALRSQLKHLTALTKDKHLGEREKLKRELEEAKDQIQDYQNKMDMLNRRLMLEGKNAKFKLNKEIGKHKQCQKELTQALAELNRSGSGSFVIEGGEVKQTSHKTKSLLNRQSLSSTSLTAETASDLGTERCVEEEPTSEVKLEPIRNASAEAIDVPKGILKCPKESVKERLSAEKANKQLSTSLRNLSIEAQKPKSPPITIPTTLKNPKLSRCGSNHKLDLLSETIQNTLRKTADREDYDEEDADLGGYCLDVVNSVKGVNVLVDKHKVHYQTNVVETSKLLDKLKEADAAASRLRKCQLAEEKVPERDVELVDKIWWDEYQANKPKDDTDKNGNVKQVSVNEKKKLLATLKAIDNGESVESIGANGFAKKNRKELMDDLFGSRGSH